jgi:hypothetical protein
MVLKAATGYLDKVIFSYTWPGPTATPGRPRARA